MEAFKLEGSVAGDWGPATSEQQQPNNQICVGNGDGGTTLINKLVVSFGPMSESTQTTQHTTTDVENNGEGADAGSEGAAAGFEGAGEEGAVEDEAVTAGPEGARGRCWRGSEV